MAKYVPLHRLDEHTNEDLAHVLQETPVVTSLREATRHVIRGIHGLPDIMECQLSQLEIYVGRAAAEPARIRQRWLDRYNEFKGWRSTHAIVCVRGLTSHIKEKSWEKSAQRLVDLLERRHALCCANAVLGNNGRWPPPSVETAIYVVARKRRGRAGYGVSPSEIKEAVVEMIQDPNLEDDEMVRLAAKQILDPEDKENLEPLEARAINSEAQANDAVKLCRMCEHPAQPGNYGFCGYHRR